MLAALALPGIAPGVALAAEEDGLDLQYGRYEEGARDLGGLKSKFAPIESDSLHHSLSLTLGDRIRANFNFLQDAWSGATPIATAPLVANGNIPTSPDGFSGASPYLYTSMQLDDQLRPLRRDANGAVIGPDTRVVHTMAGASREVRRQIDAKVVREFARSSMDIGAGISREPDYKSDFATMAGHWNLAQDRLTLNVSGSFTHSVTDATLDHDASPYIYGFYDLKGNSIYNSQHRYSQVSSGENSPIIRGTRKDWSTQIGLAGVLNRGAVLEVDLGHARSQGFLGNPYKAVEVAFIDPAQQFGSAGGNPGADYTYDAQLIAIPEERPDSRSQNTLSMRYVQHFARSGGALHVSYRYFHDDWGVRAHTLSAEWIQPLGHDWTIAPRLRYYSQSAADFFVPYVVTQQGFFSNVVDPVQGQIYVNASTPDDGHSYYEDLTYSVPPPIDDDPASWNYGNPITGINGGALIDRGSGQAVTKQSLVDSLMADRKLYDRSKLPAHYSSDTRLSAFGSISAGITLARKFHNGMSLEFGFERFRHAGSLKLGGGGEGSYADYGAYVINAVLKANFGPGVEPRMHGVHDSHAIEMIHSATDPAGLSQAHILNHAGDWMLGYRLQRDVRRGPMTFDGHVSNDAQLVASACAPNPCYVGPADMTMNMHMIDVMYALSSRVTLMLMPQFIDNRMAMRILAGAPPADGMGPIGSAIMHASHPHTSSTPGDTELHSLFRINESFEHPLIFSLGVSFPTGNHGVQMRDMHQIHMGFMDYGMQTGSGTWDIKESLTYRADGGRLHWGAQLGGTQRLQQHNSSGYSLGNAFRATAWAGAVLGAGWSGSLRVLHTQQAGLRGVFNGTLIPIGPSDYVANYGGRYWDVGIGAGLALPQLGSEHDRLAVEWLQPVRDRERGFQLRRSGMLNVSLSLSL